MREFFHELKIVLNKKPKLFSKNNVKNEIKESKTFFLYSFLYIIVPTLVEYLLFYPNSLPLFNGLVSITTLMGGFYTLNQMTQWKKRNDLNKEDKINWLKENQENIKDKLFHLELIININYLKTMKNHLDQNSIKKMIKQIDSQTITNTTFEKIANLTYDNAKLYMFLSQNEDYLSMSHTQLVQIVKNQLYECFQISQHYMKTETEKLDDYFSKELTQEKQIFKQQKSLTMNL